MLVFNIFCFNDFKQGHEGFALELALFHIFGSFAEIRPLTIVIDKHKTTLTTITNVVNKDVYCRNTNDNIRI